jgi:hypothetical protein
MREAGGDIRAARLVVRHRERSEDALELEALAREAGVHPELARRLVSLGVLDAAPGPVTGQWLFPRNAALRVARAVRLRRDLGLNYAGALLACELLERIEHLEERLRRYETANRPRR